MPMRAETLAIGRNGQHRLRRHLEQQIIDEGGVVEFCVSERTWMILMSVPSSSRWVAKRWRSVCGPTRLAMSAAWAASTTIR